MRLLHVVPTYVPAWRHGGTIESVHRLCTALARHGHEVTVFTTNVNGDSTLDVEPAAPQDRDGVSVWYFRVGFPRRLYHSPELQSALDRDLDRDGKRFDLVHLHSVFLWPTMAAARAAERAGIPYLVSPRGMLVPDLLRRHGWLRKRLWIRRYERRTIASAAGLHVTSELEKEEVKRLGLPLPPVFVVPNGVDHQAWEPGHETELAPEVRWALERRPLLLFMGRLSWKKGLDRLVAALAEVPNATLAIAGNDEEGYRARLDRQAADAGVASRILYLGFVRGADKLALLHGADLLVLPSLSENFGNVVLEAMAAGLPVVVTPEVGLADVVRQHRAGVVVEGAPRQLAAELRGLLKDEGLRREMGRRGADAARASFSWEAVAERMEEVYDNVRSARPRPRGDTSAGTPVEAGSRGASRDAAGVEAVPP